jgi:hypothetical protein
MRCAPSDACAEAAVRIVLDTNVVLSALLWHGTPRHLFQSIRQQEQMGNKGVRLHMLLSPMLREWLRLVSWQLSSRLACLPRRT